VNRWLGAFFVAGYLFGGASSMPAQERRELRAGWFLWDPYQFEINRGDVPVLSGLDVQLVRPIFQAMEYKVAFHEIPWEKHLQGLQQGTVDIAAGASYTPERAAYAWFSDPYRTETVVLMTAPSQARALRAQSVPALLEQIEATSFRLGVVRGNYYGPDMEVFLRNPAHAGHIREFSTENEALVQLAEKNIDGFLADRLVAHTIAWRARLMDAVEEHPVPIFSSGIHVIFSKATCSEEMVRAFNENLKKMKASGEYDRVTRGYLIPVLLGITVNRTWFSVLGIIGTVAFALSGVLLARRENYDIFGAFILASLPAVGGGVLRDLLTARYPVGVLRAPAVYVYVVLAVVAAGTIFYKFHDAWKNRHPGRETEEETSRRIRLPMSVVELCDAVGLSAFIVTGVVIAVEQKCEPLWLWGPLLAALTGAGGGILRDIVRADVHNPNLKGDFYPEIAVIWGLFLSLFLDWETSRLDLREIGWGVLFTMIGAFLTRLVVLRYGIRSLRLGKPVRP
jgi:polar amino acid transport system substrate-binding protein